MTQQLAFLGLGVMGMPMTANLAKANYPINAWNRTPNKQGMEIVRQSGAKITNTIAEAVSNAEIIFTCLGDVPDVEAVIFGVEGIVKYAQPDSLIVDFSTIGAKAAQKIVHQLKEYQIRFMDAPISGGDIGAKNATLTIMVGGNEADFQQCLPYLQVLGQNITYCGSIGSGQAVKLCNQVLGSLHMVALCEALQLAQQQEIDPNLIIKVCSTGAAGSWALSNLGTKIIEEDYQPGFMIKHILKDLRLVGEALVREDSLPGVKLAENLFQIAANLESGKGYTEGTQAMIKAYFSKSELADNTIS